MLAVFPQEFSSLGGWLLDEQEINNYYLFDDKNRETSDSIDLHSPNSSSIQPKNCEFPSFHHVKEGIHENKTMKKLNHNASERDRRKRINNLYSTLRSLLPLDDQSKKLSIPDTVSRVLKYIPELQKEVERLTQKKETLIITNNISSQEQDSPLLCNFNNHRIKAPIQSSSSSATVSYTRISDREIVIQLSMPRVEKGSFCEAVMNLEEEGFLVLNASSFESFEGRVFYNLHLLQVPICKFI
ncbi:hypothetical protein BUALT_Bualt12G0030300 [Buddleja alternifolia]|uniref:BHLH domain-containing protein n=1 Tax=Buddleja alternifolia TaxID=168488 RepID=A0AAV6WYU4_9LAMI|nr:hypothetical protein BUALT_Bualt12G0030300 [Buddleja alternifolia]